MDDSADLRPRAVVISLFRPLAYFCNSSDSSKTSQAIYRTFIKEQISSYQKENQPALTCNISRKVNVKTRDLISNMISMFCTVGLNEDILASCGDSPSLSHIEESILCVYPVLWIPLEPT